AWGLGRGVDEVGALERCSGELDVNELFGAQGLDEQNPAAEPRAVPARGLAHVLGPDADRQRTADVGAPRGPAGLEIGRELELAVADLAKKASVVAPHGRLEEVHGR